MAAPNSYLPAPLYVDELDPVTGVVRQVCVGNPAPTTHSNNIYILQPSSTGLRVQSIPFPTVATALQPACTLTASGYAYEGIASLSQDSSTFMVSSCARWEFRPDRKYVPAQFGCYNITAGTLAPFGAYMIPATRIVARVFNNMSFDLSVYCTDCYTGNVLSSVVSADGASQFWMAGGQFMSSNGATPSPAPEGNTGGVRCFGA